MAMHGIDKFSCKSSRISTVLINLKNEIMCNDPINNNKRIGSALEHGKAHQQEHSNWSRRSFMLTTGLAAGFGMTLGNTTVKAMGLSELTAGLAIPEDDRVLVLVRLKGGIDGLNTIVPRFDTTYYNERPTLAIPESNLFALDGQNGLPIDTMQSLQSLWQNNQMKVLHNVSYPSPDYSHFRSSEIYATGSDSDEHLNDGWVGRFVDQLMPAFIDAPPVVPPALQIGVQTNLLFQGPNAKMALTVNNAEEFYQIAQTGQLYSTNDLGDCPKDLELAFMRQTANNAFRYSESIQNAYSSSTSYNAYPDNYLAEQLEIVARLIKGRLGTKIYMVEIDGFDTHAEQAMYMPQLLIDVSTSIKAFYDDISSANMQNDTLVMSFTEFGRTYAENDSLGTDHGTGAPVLFFGENMTGIVGNQPDLSNLGPYQDPTYETDFRSIYATVLQDWLCVKPETVNYVLKQDFQRINNLISNPCSPEVGANNVSALLGHNPKRSQTNVIELKYSIKQKGNVILQLLNKQGQVLRTFVNEFREAGSYVFDFNRFAFGILPGEYVYRLVAGGKIFTRKLILK